MKKVTLKIKNGKISADYSGFKGNECDRLDERIRPTDLQEEEKEYKPEYYQSSFHSETEHNEW